MVERLLPALLLISPVSFADWGDVYYCQMTSAVVIKADGTHSEYKLEKFQFKLDEAKKSMIFGKAVTLQIVWLVSGLYFPIARNMGSP